MEKNEMDMLDEFIGTLPAVMQGAFVTLDDTAPISMYAIKKAMIRYGNKRFNEGLSAAIDKLSIDGFGRNADNIQSLKLPLQ